MVSKEDLSQRVIPLLDRRLELLRIQRYQVILSVREPMSTPERGKLLLDTERRLRKEINQRLEVFLEPKGDMSKLRQRLRGVTLDGSRDEVFARNYLAGESREDGGNNESETD